MASNSWIQIFRARWVQAERGIVEDGGVVVIHDPAHEPRILTIFDPHDSEAPTTDDLIKAAESFAAEHWAAIHAHGPKRFERLPDQCLGDVVLLPGMVNCHTHLEFSDCREPLGETGSSFAKWLSAVIAHRARAVAAVEEDFAVAKSATCDQGWLEMLEGGTVAAGEILSRPVSVRRGEDSHGQAAPELFGAIFHEVLGLDPERAHASWDWALSCLAEPRNKRVRVGLSPHAPYSTSTWLYRQCAEHGRRHGLPVATHLAESREELQLLTDRSGPLVDFLAEMGVWRPERIEARSIREVLALLSDVDRLLLVHGNYLERDDWRWLRSQNPNATIVYCPQTHAYFQHERHPWVEMMADGVPVALGTDSRASSSSLSLWEDLRVVRERYPEQDPARLWQMATIHGARALGLEQDLGSLGNGKLARFCVADLGAAVPAFSWEALLSSTTKISGRLVPGI
ncbi:MAG: amidohydrolase family protein [Pirellulaceae bacterium]|nr:amidohydrolase family protein [Pirellulaceae bacterium]